MSEFIELEGVSVNNLKNIDVRIRRNALTVICGVSGSGKSSLAFDTLFAEGQRRYVETFSPYARQFLDRVERPAAERIEGIPPAIAIRQNSSNQSARSTVGTRTEILDYLRILFAKAGTVHCPDCQQPAVSYSPDSAAKYLIASADGRRAMLTFSAERDSLRELQSSGFARCILNGATSSLEQAQENRDTRDESPVAIVTDRIRIDADAASRIAESIEQVFTLADGQCVAFIETDAGGVDSEVIDGKTWRRAVFSRKMRCPGCDREFAAAIPEVLNFQSPLGACAACEGTGQVSGMRFEKVVPDSELSIQQGAIQPWTTPAYRHELDELLLLAGDYGIPTDVPFKQVSEESRQLIYNGVPDRNFGGLAGFHRWLVKNRYKPGVSVCLNRWRSWLQCEVCRGTRLTADAGTLTFGGLTIADATSLEIEELRSVLSTSIGLLPDEFASALAVPVRQLNNRLGFLCDCRLGYLSLGRSMKTLSGGEAQRVVLTSVLGSGLINTLYVLDEPTSGLHAEDTQRVISAARKLTAPGNTVVVVEHDPEFIRAADEVIEIGPDAGDAGGEVVFCGAPAKLLEGGSTATADCLQKQSSQNAPSRDKRVPQKWIGFDGVNCHSLKGVSGRLPLELICAVTGVSGSGKSSLVVDALYPELCRRLGQSGEVEAEGSVASMDGHESVNDVCLLGQTPLPRSRRSIPATIVGAFDDIRKVMAETHEARKRNYKPGMFSFNSTRGGRCVNCEGHGVVTVEMQFLADIATTCEACKGRRFRMEVLEVRYRDRSIFDILQMTADDAFVFFNGHRRIQQRLNALRQAGLGYTRLGQPVGTLSGGESQRLRIAALLAGVPLDDDLALSQRSRQTKNTAGTLFVLDEPSTGLHMQDIDALMKCLNHLVEIGHSVVIIEHNEQVVQSCDYRIELGPGAGRHGGQIVASGQIPLSKSR